MGLAAPKKITQVTVRNEHTLSKAAVWHIYDIKSQSDFIKMINEEVPDRKFVTSKRNTIADYQTRSLPEDRIGIWCFCILEWYDQLAEENRVDLVVYPVRVLLEMLQEAHDEYEAYTLGYANAIATLYHHKLGIRDED